MSNLNIPSTRVLSSPLKKGKKKKKAPVIKQNSMSINDSKLWEKQSQKKFYKYHYATKSSIKYNTKFQNSKNKFIN